MPVRQRSPSSQGSAAASAFATSFQTTTTSMPQDPNYSDASAYRTMRSRNPDGSSTVYRVHESVMRGGGGVMGTTPTSAPPPPNGPYCRGGGHGGGGIDSTPYASYAPSSYSPYNCHIGAHHQQQQQQHVIFVQGNDGVDEDWEDEGSDGDGYGDDESRLVPFSSSSSTSTATSISTPPKRTRPWCARNSTPCILSYMILAIAFVIGYVYLIEAFVERSRASRASVAVAVPPSSASSPSGGLRGGGVADVDMAQPSSSSSSSRPHVPPAGGAAALTGQLDLDLEPQYYVLEKVIRPVGVGEVPHVVTSGRSLPKEDGTRVIVATGDDSDTSGGVDASPMGGSASLLTPDGGTIVRGGSDEPVRRKMYAGGREKK